MAVTMPGLGYGVQPLILVVQHTFGRHLNFNAHLHMLVSAGGLLQSENRWIGSLSINPLGLMKLWGTRLSLIYGWP
jgi:hypothetical protein